MAIRNIRELGEPCLRKICKPVKEVNLRTKILIGDMFDTMYEANGVGLAAPQGGNLKKNICKLTVEMKKVIQYHMYLSILKLLIEKVFRQDTKDVLAYRASQVWFQEHRK